MEILIKRKLGLHVLDKAWQHGKPPVQVRENFVISDISLYPFRYKRSLLTWD